MKSSTLRAALTAALLLGAATTAYAADSSPKLSHGVAVALADVQKAMGTKDYAAAAAGLEKAKAAASTPYDTLMVSRFSMGVHVGQNDMAAADVDAEAAADTDPAVIPDADKAAVYKPALQLTLNAKKYDKAAKYAKLYLATTPPPTGNDVALATQALYLGGDYAGATALAQKNIDAAKAAGKTPVRNDLDIIMSAQVKQKDEAGAETTLEQLVQYYGQAEDWGQLLGVSLSAKGMREIDYVYVGRLALLLNLKISQQDAQLIGGVANSNSLALYGDAEAMQKLGGPAPDPRIAADKKSLPDQIKVGQGPKGTGEFNVKLAEALYGYSMYPEAEAAARLALQKGGTKDASEPNLILGEVLAAQGKYADAATAFAASTGGTPATQRVVRLWTIFVKQKQSPVTAAAPAQ